ncbi:hypothetical protein [Aquipuribacter nitratireducens]|uniref:Uncharacterized protein n=1 Tax=Aquipuribacter nitratireducens TaxID=650104 RepID=A0ABW0GQE5_9MICO
MTATPDRAPAPVAPGGESGPPNASRQPRRAPVRGARPLPPGGRARRRLLAAGATLPAVGLAAILLWRPGAPRNTFDHSLLVPVREAVWASGVVDGLLTALALAAFALAGCVLVRGRGRAWVDGGAVLLLVGAPLAASGPFAFGVLVWYAGDPAFSGSATTLLETVRADIGPLYGPVAAGTVLAGLGTLAVCVGLWRADRVGRVLPVALAVTTVLVFAVPSGRLTDVVQALQLLLVAAVGATLLGVREERW